MEKEVNYIYQKIVVSEGDNLYKISLVGSDGDKVKPAKITPSFLIKNYVNGHKADGLFSKLKNSKYIKVQHDIVSELIDYHAKAGNFLYVNALKNCNFCNKIALVYEDYGYDKDSTLPWMVNDALYEMFLDSKINVSKQMFFVAEEQLNSKNICTKDEYELFYSDVYNLMSICHTGAYQIERSVDFIPNLDLDNDFDAEDSSSNDVANLNQISLIYGKNDIVIRDVTQMRQYINNILHDENYDINGTVLHTDDDIVVFSKKGVLYISDNNTGNIEMYIAPEMKYES